MEKEIDETIENICSWINDRLNDSMIIEEMYATADMVTALADLVSTRADLAIEKRVADLEGQVQSQQKRVFVPEDSDGVNTSGTNCTNP